MQVYVSLGSNSQREQRICCALDALEARFGTLAISPVYESEAVGHDGEHFLNLVVGFECLLTVLDLRAVLRAIEHDNGRVREQTQAHICALDIDILLYGELCGELDCIMLPHPDLLQHAFVLRPLAELVPQHQHPVLRERYAQLWQAACDKTQHTLWPVAFVWRDGVLGEALTR